MAAVVQSSSSQVATNPNEIEAPKKKHKKSGRVKHIEIEPANTDENDISALQNSITRFNKLHELLKSQNLLTTDDPDEDQTYVKNSCFGTWCIGRVFTKVIPFGMILGGGAEFILRLLDLIDLKEKKCEILWGVIGTGIGVSATIILAGIVNHYYNKLKKKDAEVDEKNKEIARDRFIFAFLMTELEKLKKSVNDPHQDKRTREEKDQEISRHAEQCLMLTSKCSQLDLAGRVTREELVSLVLHQVKTTDSKLSTLFETATQTGQESPRAAKKRRRKSLGEGEEAASPSQELSAHEPSDSLQVAQPSDSCTKLFEYLNKQRRCQVRYLVTEKGVLGRDGIMYTSVEEAEKHIPAYNPKDDEDSDDVVIDMTPPRKTRSKILVPAEAPDHVVIDMSPAHAS